MMHFISPQLRSYFLFRLVAPCLLFLCSLSSAALALNIDVKTFTLANGMQVVVIPDHREVRAADPLRFTTVLLGHDAKRIHYLHAMYHAVDGFLAATNELMSLHVSRATRRAAVMAPEILDRLAAIQRTHDALPRPPQAGRAIALANPPRGM